MAKPLKIDHQMLVSQALEQIETLSVEEAVAALSDEGVTFVDLRDPRELEREGRIPGSVHAPRGMIEFWVDPSSPYFKPVFGNGNRFVFYCQSGYFAPVCHFEGGYRAWKDAGAPTEAMPERPAKRSADKQN
jgi:rhodanese-related sulfurtransferase